MEANQANTAWSATALAQDEASIRAAALSVRQRKLLALLATPMTVESLSNMSGLPHAEVEANLTRFAKLGLCASSGDAAAASPAAFRASSFGGDGASATSRMPLILGGVALTAVAAAIWWFTRSEPTSVPTAPPVARANPATPAPPALASPGDVSTTNVFVSAAPLASPPNAAPVNPQDAAKLAAAAREREAAAREAAKNAKQPAQTAAQVPAAPPPAPPAATAQAAPATPPPPAPAPPAPAPAPAPVAAAAPTPAPAAAPAAPRPAAPAPAAREGALLSRVEPAFPRGVDVDRGTVRARLTVNATGAVTNVEVVEATPPRVFDRSVRLALAQWRYEGTGETQTKLVEVQFNR